MIMLPPATALASLRTILHRAADDAARGAQDLHLHRVQDAQIRRPAALHRAGGTWDTSPHQTDFRDEND